MRLRVGPTLPGSSAHCLIQLVPTRRPAAPDRHPVPALVGAAQNAGRFIDTHPAAMPRLPASSDPHRQEYLRPSKRKQERRRNVSVAPRRKKSFLCLRSFLSDWHRGVEWGELRRGNVERFVALGYFEKVRFVEGNEEQKGSRAVHVIWGGGWVGWGKGGGVLGAFRCATKKLALEANRIPCQWLQLVLTAMGGHTRSCTIHREARVGRSSRLHTFKRGRAHV